MKDTDDHFFKHEPTLLEKLIQFIESIPSTTMERFYIVDVLQNQFCYICDDDFFLRGFSMEDALKEGTGFYDRIVFSEDLPLWTHMQNLVLQYLADAKEKQDHIAYFSCTFRLHCLHLSSPHHLLSQMIYHRTNPVWEGNVLRYLVCSGISSVSKKVGNLHMYHKDGLAYKTYNFNSNRWELRMIASLSGRERNILMLSQQNMCIKDIADLLCKSPKTIDNQIQSLFKKLDVHSMQEAIEYVSNHRLIYSKRDKEK